MDSSESVMPHSIFFVVSVVSETLYLPSRSSHLDSVFLCAYLVIIGLLVVLRPYPADSDYALEATTLHAFDSRSLKATILHASLYIWGKSSIGVKSLVRVIAPKTAGAGRHWKNVEADGTTTQSSVSSIVAYCLHWHKDVLKVIRSYSQRKGRRVRNERCAVMLPSFTRK